MLPCAMQPVWAFVDARGRFDGDSRVRLPDMETGLIPGGVS